MSSLLSHFNRRREACEARFKPFGLRAWGLGFTGWGLGFWDLGFRVYLGAELLHFKKFLGIIYL